MKRVIIFGIGENAQLLKYYLENDIEYKGEYTVEAFTLDKEYVLENTFMGKPLVPFQQIEKIYDPEEYYIFIALGYTKMNNLRETKYLEAKSKGFKFFNYISSKAFYSGNKIGENNLILESSVIQPFVEIGNNNVIMGGGLIGHHTKIYNNCFFAGESNLGGKCIIKNNCFIGLNASIRDNLILENKTLVGGGAWISNNTEEGGVYIAEKALKINKKSLEIKI